MEQAELREYKDILAQAGEIGKYLLSSGAEVSRVEDTIERILHAYGAAQVDVFALQSLILASVKLSDGSECIRARRVVNTGTNLRQLEDLNQLAREICANRPTAAEIEARLKDILARKSNPLLTLAGYLLAVFTMAVFFGGTVRDGAAAAAIAVVIFGIDRYLRKTEYNLFVYTLFSSLIAGLLAVLCVKSGFGEHMDKIMIGDIMLFIPGLALCNAVKDILHKDHLTGVSRVVEALMVTLFIAFGFYIASLTVGGMVSSNRPGVSDWVQILCGAGGSVGYALFFLARPDKLPLALVGGGLAWGIYLLVWHACPSIFLASAVAAAAVCVYSEIVSRVVKAPANIFMITALIPLLPGSYLYYATAGLVSHSMAQFYDYGSRVLQATLGIEGGILIAYFLFMHILGLRAKLKAKAAHP